MCFGLYPQSLIFVSRPPHPTHSTTETNACIKWDAKKQFQQSLTFKFWQLKVEWATPSIKSLSTWSKNNFFSENILFVNQYYKKTSYFISQLHKPKKKKKKTFNYDHIQLYLYLNTVTSPKTSWLSLLKKLKTSLNGSSYQ